MPIGLNQHRKAITQASIAKFKDDTTPLMGLSTFFKKKTTRAKGVSIEVRRMAKRIAPDVQRCTDPVRVTFSKSTEKIYIPPFYSLVVDFTACQGYDISFGMGIEPTGEAADMMIDSASEEIVAMKNMILRALELQHSTLLQTGIVTLKNADSIDFKRLAASMVTKAGGAAWDQNTSNKLGDMDAAGLFLRQKGRSVGNEINAIFGSEALGYFLADEAVNRERSIFSTFRRADIGRPELNEATGLVFHGRVSSQEFNFNIWSYSETYENAAGDEVPYIDPKKIVFLPNDFEGVDAFGGIPTVFNPNTDNQYVAPMEGEFVITDLIDQRKATWDINVKSAPVAVPVSVDRIYTLIVK